jgi:hypothetical protein
MLATIQNILYSCRLSKNFKTEKIIYNFTHYSILVWNLFSYIIKRKMDIPGYIKFVWDQSV